MIKCANCTDSHSTVAEVRACHGASGKLPDADLPAPEADRQMVQQAQERARQANAASAKQVSFIESLVQERDIESLNGNLYERAFDISTGSGKFISKSEASDLITALKAAPCRKKWDREGGLAPEEVLEGTHMRNGKFIRVQRAVHGSGNLYAKIFNEDTESWDYAGRAPLYDLNENTKLTAEEAARFGHLYGSCVFCGRTLTDERSIKVGYGPICADHNSLPWG